MKRWIYLLLCSWNIAFASISLEIDPPNISLGDTVRIILTLPDIKNRSIPDLTPLLSDFEVLSTERTMSYTVLNHQAQSISQWGIVLKPKKTGVLTIPPIHIGQDQSVAGQVSVKGSSSSNTSTNKQVQSTDASSLITEVDNPSPFVNEQVVYTVKLYNRQHLLDAQYRAPELEDALLIPLGEGRHYQTELHGESYDVDEQQYAIFPQKKGALSIQPPAFEALIYDGFAPKRIVLRGQPITLQVKPVLQDQKAFLPAKQVLLSETYDWSGKNADEGSTITRTINLKAAGVVAELLPTLTFKHHEQYRVYPGKPTLENQVTDHVLWGNSTIQVSYLLSKPGQITLPSIKVPWYNVKTKQVETATLPARTFTVKAKETPRHHHILSKKPKTIKVAQPLTQAFYPTWWWMALVFMIVVTFGAFIYRRLRTQTGETTQSPEYSKEDLHKACQSHDPKRVRAALLAFAVKRWPEVSILNLNDIPIHDPVFKTLMEQLSEALYSHNKTPWRGDALWRYLSKLPSSKKKPRKRKLKLPPIYPDKGSIT